MTKLKYTFYSGLCLLLMQSCGSLKHIAQHNLKSGMAWEVKYTRTDTALPGATQDEKEKVAGRQKDSTSIAMVTYIAKDRYRRSLSGPYPFDLIIDQKNDMVLMRYSGGEVTRIAYTDFVSRRKQDTVTRFTHLKLYPDSLKTILGFQSYKATYQTTKDSIHVTSWHTKALPSWEKILGENEQIPGFVLEALALKDHILKKIKVVSIRQIPITDTLFSFSDDSSIQQYKPLAENNPSDHLQNDAFTKSRKKLLKKLNQIKKQKYWQESAIAKYGYIHIKTKDTSFYVNKNGEYAFDKILSTYHPIGKAEAAGPGWVNLEKADSITMLMVEKNGKIGLIQSDSGWVLPAEYDRMQIDYKRYLALYKNGKTGYADTWGNLLVPAKFDEVKIMNTNYFDVRVGDKWSIYSRQQKQLILPLEYDGFDFCGGCGSKVDYAYASKNGKWGVINFNGKVLLPFEYDHPGHYGMRGDEWVTSFTQNGKEMVINLNTQKVYSETDYEDMQIISGVLALKKNGKYGLMDGNGQQLLLFAYDDMGDPYTNFEWGPFIQIYKNGKCGIADNEGNIIIPPDKYAGIYVQGDYFGARIGVDDWVVLNRQGESITPLGYSVSNWRYPMKAVDSSDSVNLVYVIEKAGKEGFYNAQTGDFVKPQFSSVYLLRPGDSLRSYVRVENQDGRYGLYSIYGKRLTPALYEDFDLIGNGMVKMRRNGKYGLYDLKNAREIAPVKYDYISRIDRRFVLLKRSDSCCKAAKIYDATKQKIFSLPYEQVDPAGDGMLLVNDSSYTYLYSLQKGKIVSKGYPIHRYGKYAYEGINFGRHGLFKVSYKGKTGYINKTGKEIIPVKYDRVKMNKQGIIQLKNEPEHTLLTYQYADSSGRFLSDSVFSYKEGYHYDYPYHFQQGKYLFISRYDATAGQNLFGIMNRKGEIIIPPKYTKVFPSENGNGFMVALGDEWGLLDENGKVIIPVVLDNIYTRPTMSREKKDLRFPALCELEGMYFYVKKNGEFLPFVTDGVK